MAARRWSRCPSGWAFFSPSRGVTLICTAPLMSGNGAVDEDVFVPRRRPGPSFEGPALWVPAFAGKRLMLSRHYVLAAGGTGGHMIPAHALAEELMRRGHRVALVTDDRGARIPGLFDGVQVHILPAGRLGGGPAGWLKAVGNIFTGRAMALRLYETFRPAAVIGFGGYPALPALLAAQRDRIPTLVHEQNAVLGRVNRLMAGRVAAIATAYPNLQR